MRHLAAQKFAQEKPGQDGQRKAWEWTTFLSSSPQGRSLL
jgi:hypothetical protein